MAKVIKNRIWFIVASTGTGNITTGAAVSAQYLTPANQSIANGDTFDYFMLNPNGDWEIGLGTYISATPAFSRTVVQSSIAGVLGTTAITVAANATVMLAPSAASLAALADIGVANIFTAAQTIQQSTGGLLHVKNTTAPGTNGMSGGGIDSTIKDSTSTDRVVGSLLWSWVDATAKTAQAIISNMIAGVTTAIMTIGTGIQIGAPTGGDPGAGWINAASGFKLNGSDIKSVGIGQTWQDVKASRAYATNYTNSTGRPIQVSVMTFGNSNNSSFLVDGVTAGQGNTSASATGVSGVIVPPGSVYRFNSTDTPLTLWAELR